MSLPKNRIRGRLKTVEFQHIAMAACNNLVNTEHKAYEILEIENYRRITDSRYGQVTITVPKLVMRSC